MNQGTFGSWVSIMAFFPLHFAYSVGVKVICCTEGERGRDDCNEMGSFREMLKISSRFYGNVKEIDKV